VSKSHYILAGIDEAGYGPLLGPLCVGLSVFQVPAGESGGPQLDLWQLLEQGVCREPGRGGKPDAKGRIAIADSKQLKLSSTVKTTHPLVHLERGVLAMLLVRGLNRLDDDVGIHAQPMTDDWLLAQLEATWPNAPWYRALDPQTLPLANHEGQLRITAALLRRTLLATNVVPLALCCRVMGEGEFNALARENNGGKAATTGAALREHLRLVWERWGIVEGDAPISTGRLGIVCDRQGGRAMYGPFLAWCFPDATVTTVEESDVRSRYVVEQVEGGVRRRAGISFLVEAEQAHLPVALASMIAKLVRELAMLRFNRAWNDVARQRAHVELKPTAGYATDGARWLQDARELLTRSERDAVIRIV